ncbi:hypothetical protein BD769DRAFT_1392257 [Suillus cothurnatus]|nr:hypothetical protein BD769DRAFT_1392257 [Suillus cothurnatus]
MAKSTRRRSSSQGGPSHVRQGAGLPDSEQLDDGTGESKSLRRKRRAVLIVSDDEEVDEEALCVGEIDDVSTHCRPGDMPSYIPLGAPLKARYTAQDLAPGFMKAVVAGVGDLNFVHWYCDTAEGCTQCAQKDIKCRYPISENFSQCELRCIPCGKGRGMDCSWSKDLKQAYLREAYQLDVGEARILVSSTDDDPQATLATYYQAWRTDPATHALDDNDRLFLRKIQGGIRPTRVTRSKLIATTPTPPPPPSTLASARTHLKGPSHSNPVTPDQFAAPLPSHTHRNPSDDVARSDRVTPPPSTAGPPPLATPTASADHLLLQIHGRPSIEATSSWVDAEYTVPNHNAGGRLPDSAHILKDAQINSPHVDASPAADVLATVRPVLPHLPDLPGEAVQGLDQFLKSLLGSNSSTTRPLQEKIYTLEAELQQVKLELEAEKALRLAHAVDGDKIIADQEKTIGDRDEIIAGQQRTIAELKRNIAKMDICSQAARYLISGQPNIPSSMPAADVIADATPPGGQCQVTTSDARDLMLTLLPTISSHADLAGRRWVEHLCRLVRGTSLPIIGKRSAVEISGSSEGRGQKSQAKRRKMGLAPSESQTMVNPWLASDITVGIIYAYTEELTRHLVSEATKLPNAPYMSEHRRLMDLVMSKGEEKSGAEKEK